MILFSSIQLHFCLKSLFHCRFHLVDEPEPVSVSAVRTGTCMLNPTHKINKFHILFEELPYYSYFFLSLSLSLTNRFPVPEIPRFFTFVCLVSSCIHPLFLSLQGQTIIYWLSEITLNQWPMEMMTSSCLQVSGHRGVDRNDRMLMDR